MKKIIFSLALTTLTLNFLSAQIEVGISLGPSVSNMRVSGINNLIRDPDPFAGFKGGLQLSYTPVSSFSLVSGIHYHSTGFVARQNLGFEVFDIDIPAEVKAITRLHFLEMPVLARLNLGQGKVRAYLEAGPQMSLAMDGEIIARANFLIDFRLGTYDINMNNSNFRQFELAGVAGAGLKWDLSERMGMNLGIQYLHGFTDLTSEPIVDIHTSRYAVSGQLGVQYKF
jgi:hypothetical protein